ncbi:biotin carboxylase N-terminal domain-containing protein [Sorangium sp. So ce375]|uniref:biotin carboxylase N-terminal domain-containing protein n=1 Tax=Sorangium sp. So ce375 TaxID=3133306 RepID=UPI003F5C9C03
MADHGEIAGRILRSPCAADIQGVAIDSAVDRGSFHVRLADESYAIGPAPAAESHLCVGRILDVARHSGADAIHPGTASSRNTPSSRRPASGRASPRRTILRPRHVELQMPIERATSCISMGATSRLRCAKRWSGVALSDSQPRAGAAHE